MIIGLAGAHRVGKTTLAKQYAADHGLYFLETSVTGVFVKLGRVPSDPMTFADRLEVQEEILKYLEGEYSRASMKNGCITDRTPLDMIAYTMGDAIGDTVPEELQERFAKYIENCFALTNKYFGVIALVQPGIPLVVAEGKAAINRAYIEHLNTIILGLLSDPRMTIQGYSVRRSSVDLPGRMAILAAIHERMTDAAVGEFAAHTAEGKLLN